MAIKYVIFSLTFERQYCLMILIGYYLCQKTLLKFDKTGGGAIFGAVGPAIRRYMYIVSYASRG